MENINLDSEKLVFQSNPKYLETLMSQLFVIEDLTFFNNIKKYPSDVFILSMYNFMSALKEHNKHLAVCLTKVPYDKCAVNIINALKENISENSSNNYKIFDDFLMQLKNTTNTEQYYKKFSVSMPVDKLCNDICKNILEKSWVHTIASIITFDYVVMTINKKLNEYVKTLEKTNLILLSENNSQSVELLRLLDDENKTDVTLGINEMLNAFCTMFNEIDELYYMDM